MKEYAIHVSEPAYQHLLEQVARLNATPEQLIERLLAAVQRISMLFADVKVDNLEDL